MHSLGSLSSESFIEVTICTSVFQSLWHVKVLLARVKMQSSGFWETAVYFGPGSAVSWLES